MSSINTLLAATLSALLLVACSGDQPEVSPQQREALSDEMMEPDSLSGGYMPGMGIGTF